MTRLGEDLAAAFFLLVLADLLLAELALLTAFLAVAFFLVVFFADDFFAADFLAIWRHPSGLVDWKGDSRVILHLPLGLGLFVRSTQSGAGSQV